MRVALVYDRVNKLGGAERVLLALKKIFPNAVLFTSVYSKKKARWAKNFKIKTSFLQRFKFAITHHELLPMLMPLAFESFTFEDYDLVISVTSEAAKGIITKPKTTHICICLTPTRYLWSGYKDYFKNVLLAFFAKPILAYLRTWDTIAALRPDVYIAISLEVKYRIKKYYKRNSKVIYPPLVKYFSQRKLKKTKGGYFLVVSRLSKFTQYKRVDLAIKACSKLNLPLVVVGDGDTGYYKKFAGPRVKFVGKISDKQLAKYYLGCRALIFPGLEDFGLVMVEAQSFGKPVIAFKAGGALEIIKNRQTGSFFTEQTVASLSRSLKRFNESRYNSSKCQRNAQRFSFKHFKKELKFELKRLKKL